MLFTSRHLRRVPALHGKQTYMNAVKNILLASHGSDGAREAERAAFALCEGNARIHHLYVVPEFWKGMTGDDWLNNGVSRDRFTGYLEKELGEEIDANRERLEQEAASRNINYTFEFVVGKPDECLIDLHKRMHFDVIVLGSPRPRGKPGLRSRMVTKPLSRALQEQLMIVPYPQ